MFDPTDPEVGHSPYPHFMSLASLYQDDGMGEAVDSTVSWVPLDEFPDIFDPYFHFISEGRLDFYDLP